MSSNITQRQQGQWLQLKRVGCAGQAITPSLSVEMADHLPATGHSLQGPLLTWGMGIGFAVFILLTLLPLSRSPVWWVRGADFPRLQLFVMGVFLIGAELAILNPESWVDNVAKVITLTGLLYHTWWIWPYTVFHAREVKTAVGGKSGQRIRIISVNVLTSNRSAPDLLRIIKAERPDVVVTLETNEWWERALQSLESDYPHRLRCPLENLYGMHLYSRFPLEDAKIQFLVEPDVPSMHTLLVLPSGRRVRLHCLHPAPPSPTENPTSEERDAELVMVGRAVAAAKLPVIVSGDLNDVAWSATTRLFRKLSGLLDPRIGRGMYNTFHARYFFCRWPVDHFFHSRQFTVVRLGRLAYCGSDHFPVMVELALDDSAAEEQVGLAKDGDAEAQAQEKLGQKSVSPSTVHCPGENHTAET